MTINLLTKLGESSNQNIESSFFLSTLEKNSFIFFKNICRYLEPKDFVSLVISCGTIHKIYNLYKERYPLDFGDLITQIHFNFFNTKCVQYLSNKMINFCIENEENKLNLLFKFFIIYKKFNEITIEDLGLFVELIAGNGYVDILETIITYNRFQEIPIDQIGIALGLAAETNHINTVQCIMNSNRFQEIPIEHVAVALKLAADPGYLNIVQHIINSDRFEDISTEQVTIALENLFNNRNI